MLPNEKAPNPEEDSQQRISQGRGEDDGVSPTTPTDGRNVRKKMGITFDDATASEPASQSTSIYKEVLSQPPSTMSHRERLLWLQKRHTAGLWVRCDDCDQWRFLPYVTEAQELPEQWRCTMNPDKSYANCSVPEIPLPIRDEEDLIHNEYSAGSIVWARLAGWPWWPAMVDDDPDTEQYYWLDGFCDIPTHYNVTFFDENEATHAWIAPNQLKPYAKNRGMAKQVAKEKKYKKRLGAALTQAEDACRLSLQKRLTQYSFLARYSGTINSPKKVSKRELKRFNDRFKNRYNVALQMLDSSDESEDEYLVETKRRKIPVKQNKIVSGKGKKIKMPIEKTGEKRIKTLSDKRKIQKAVEKTVKDTAEKRSANDVDNADNAKSENRETSAENAEISVEDVPQTKKPETMDTQEQISEKNDSEILKNHEVPNENIYSETHPEAEDSFDNDTSDTYVPPKDLPTQSTCTENIQSQPIGPNDTQPELVPEDFDMTLADTPTGRPQNIMVKRNLESSMEQVFLECTAGAPASQDVITPTPARVKPVFKTPNSLSVQVGTNAVEASTVESDDNDTSKTYIPESQSESETMESLRETVRNIRARSTSGGSDDFDF